VSVERGAVSDPATYIVNAGAGLPSEALAAAVVGGGLGLLEMGPAATDLEALFLGLTSGRPEAPA
jgi:hypothetical protein